MLFIVWKDARDASTQNEFWANVTRILPGYIEDDGCVLFETPDHSVYMADTADIIRLGISFDAVSGLAACYPL